MVSTALAMWGTLFLRRALYSLNSAAVCPVVNTGKHAVAWSALRGAATLDVAMVGWCWLHAVKLESCPWYLRQTAGASPAKPCRNHTPIEDSSLYTRPPETGPKKPYLSWSAMHASCCQQIKIPVGGVATACGPSAWARCNRVGMHSGACPIPVREGGAYGGCDIAA